MKELILKAAALTCAGIVVGVASHWTRFGKPLVALTVEAAVCDPADDVSVVAMSPESAGDLCNHEDVLVLDVRDSEDYAHGHVTNAVHLPCAKESLEERLTAQLARAHTVIVYGNDAEHARPVAETLARRRVPDVRIIEGGYPAWEAAGQACAAGACETAMRTPMTPQGMIVWVLKVTLGVIFFAAGWDKLVDPITFVEQVSNFELFPSLSPLVATTLPGVEVVLAVALIATAPRSGWLRASAVCTAGLMLIFTIAVTQAWLRGINIECGCFGSDTGPITWLTVLRDVALLAATAVLVVLAYRLTKVPALTPR